MTMQTRRGQRELPKHVHYKHGKFYFVRNGVWTNLGEDKQQAILAAESLFEYQDDRKEELVKFVQRVIARARQNAKGRRGIPFLLVKEDARRLLIQARWVCAVTGTPFSFDTIGGRKPFAPSVDRINSSGGYTAENCRIVCVAANYAMNTWGESVLRTMATNMVSVRRLIDESRKSSVSH